MVVRKSEIYFELLKIQFNEYTFYMVVGISKRAGIISNDSTNPESHQQKDHVQRLIPAHSIASIVIIKKMPACVGSSMVSSLCQYLHKILLWLLGRNALANKLTVRSITLKRSFYEITKNCRDSRVACITNTKKKGRSAHNTYFTP